MINEIIKKPIEHSFSIDEMCLFVEKYIYEKKNKTVSINRIMMPQDVMKLNIAFNSAYVYFKNGRSNI